MPKTTNQQVFLCLSEAETHQKSIEDWEVYPDEEVYPLGIKKCMVELEDGSLVSAWASTWERYYG